MSLTDEIGALRRHLEELARNPDDELTTRYTLRLPRMPPGLYWKFRWLIGLGLRCLESTGIWRPDPWPAGLKQAAASAKSRPVLIWAIGTDRDSLREACARLSRMADSWPAYVPVLVTDVADFAFFSRLGWLVEYVPRLMGEGEPYEERKARFLARLYQGAPALPVNVGLEAACQAEDIRRWLARTA